MSERIKQIKDSVEGKLEALQAKAEALSAQFGLSKEKRVQRIEERKRTLRDALIRLRAEIARQQDLADERKRKIASAIDDLKLQIILGKAEASDALEAQGKELNAAMRAFEATIGKLMAQARSKADAASHPMIVRYAQARDALTAELEAAAARVKEEAVHSGAALSQRKRELKKRMDRLRDQVGEQRKRVGERVRQFERDLKPGVDQIGKALKNLFA